MQPTREREQTRTVPWLEVGTVHEFFLFSRVIVLLLPSSLWSAGSLHLCIRSSDALPRFRASLTITTSQASQGERGGIVRCLYGIEETERPIPPRAPSTSIFIGSERRTRAIKKGLPDQKKNGFAYTVKNMPAHYSSRIVARLSRSLFSLWVFADLVGSNPEIHCLTVQQTVSIRCAFRGFQSEQSCVGKKERAVAISWVFQGISVLRERVFLNLFRLRFPTNSSVWATTFI